MWSPASAPRRRLPRPHARRRLRQALDGNGHAGGVWGSHPHLRRAERHYRDMQDLESRSSRASCGCCRPARASAPPRPLKIARPRRRGPDHEAGSGRPHRAGLADQLLHPTIDPNAERKVIATGLPASPGAVGRHVFSADDAETLKAQTRRSWAGRDSPEDIHGTHAAEGILTARGGMTPHAAGGGAAWESPACQAGRAALITPPVPRAWPHTLGGRRHHYRRPGRCSPAACR